MAPKKLNVAVAGLGRMGKRHALNFHQRVPRANLVAVFTPDPSEQEWAREHLEPDGVKLYTDYTAMLKHQNLDAVVVATATLVHAEESIEALRAGKHVLCEKPLSTSVEVSQSVVDEARRHPELKVLCGFSRRFDASYQNAAKRASRGDVGTVSVIRSQTCDKLDTTGFFVAYSEKNGGIFVDCNIHDIDLVLWFFGASARVKSVSAIGITAVEPELAKWGDVDNGVALLEFHGGRIAYLYSSRMMATGQHDMTEIVGTRGKLVVNAQPSTDLVEAWESSGVRREIPPDYWGRFEMAFVREGNVFVEACLDGKELPFDLEGAVRAVKIGVALQESLRSGEKIWFDERGERVRRVKAKL